MNNIIINKTLKLFKYVTYFLAAFYLSNVYADEGFINLTATEIIGYQQSPTVYVELEVNKTRDLHVVIQTVDGSNPINRTMKRIKQSGKYHFEVEIDDLKPGKYRVVSYLTPKGKNWSDRIDQATPFNFEVINKPEYIKQISFSNQDKINFVKWPKKIIGTQEANLVIQFEITEPRDLHIKLLDSDNWKEHGAFKLPVVEPGNMSLPLSNLKADFPIGNYAWVVFLAPTGENEPVSEKFGKHFTLTDKATK
ncbi:hypothetical protein [Colwellia echini]|uniref:DUF4198 domain-containing protein n=1 Tax=Colwellia echini TaxID=1982103 RepID=A0ABY3MYS9_9GAMM|nr:hypothetical protein [Colwellia echini]TYK66234.1 hypothetical protein CWS31_006450 [Colwellia echini]